MQEPAPWFANGACHMLYTGGWEQAALGYATALRATGPWTKHPVAVIGNGAGGMPGPTAHHNVYVEGQTVYAYYPDQINGGNLRVATASVSAPTVWTTVGTALATTAIATGIVNTSLVRRGSSDYVLMFESRSTAGPMWQIGYATGATPLGPFTVQAFPLSTLSQGDATAMYGGPFLVQENGGWTLVYHAAPTSTLPTRIYRATSTDLVTWAKESVPVIPRTTPDRDQTADFALVGASSAGPFTALFDEMDNVIPAGRIVALTAAPGSVQYDGTGWVSLSAPPVPQPSGRFTATLPAALDVTTTASWVTVLTAKYAPTRDERFTHDGHYLIQATTTGASFYVRLVVTPAPGQWGGSAQTYDEQVPASGTRCVSLPLSGDLKADVTYQFAVQVYCTAPVHVFGGITGNTVLSVQTTAR